MIKTKNTLLKLALLAVGIELITIPFSILGSRYVSKFLNQNHSCPSYNAYTLIIEVLSVLSLIIATVGLIVAVKQKQLVPSIVIILFIILLAFGAFWSALLSGFCINF